MPSIVTTVFIRGRTIYEHRYYVLSSIITLYVSSSEHESQFVQLDRYAVYKKRHIRDLSKRLETLLLSYLYYCDASLEQPCLGV